MSKLKTRIERGVPDVAGALQAIRTKKTREQIKMERLLPFVPVIEEALNAGWMWSPIAALIRKSGGPSLTKREIDGLYAQIKTKDGLDNSEKISGGVPTVESIDAPRAVAEKGEGA